MKVKLSERFKKAYQKLPKSIQRKTKKAIAFLEQNDRYPSLRVKRIQGTGNLFEGRVDHKYRFSFEYVGEDNIVLRNVDNHDECLKNP